MPKMNGLILSQKLKNIDPALLFCYITADKEYIQNLKNSISDIEKIVIYKPILLSELRDKIHFLLLSKYQAEEVENKLLMIL